MDNVQEYETIVNSIDKDTEVFVIDSTKDALEQMASIASTFSNIDAVHIFSHGDSGELNFGQTNLNQENITSYSPLLSQIVSSLSSDGDILLYGCNVANGATGIEFINKLSQITNADIAASNDLTGNSALGGDWVLETHSGSVETKALSAELFNRVLTALPTISGKETATVNEDSSVTISGISVSDSDSSTLTVKIISSHGNLSLGSSTNLTVTGGGTHTLTFSGAISDLNNALATLSYQGDANFNGTDPLTITVDDGNGEQPYVINQTGKFFNPDNGHYYEYVSSSGITWQNAKTAAQGKTLYGLNGYLVTVTSAEEQAFVAPKLGGEGWMGASDATTEGTWIWVTGPETGIHFYNGWSEADTSSAPATGYSATHNSAVEGQYNNWLTGEPNNWGRDEDYAHFRNDGGWNDYAGGNSAIQGYIVEYGGAGESLQAANLTITVNALNDAPQNTIPSAQTTNEDTAKVFSSGNGNAITVTDAENATLTTTVSIASGKGALSITASGHGASVSATAISIQLEGTATQINSALEGLTYTPTANANGAGYATLTVLTSDGVTADTDTVTINVTAVDDAPVASSMAANVSPNSKQLFSAFTPTFSDAEENSPTDLKILSMPSKGSFEVYDGDGDRNDDANWTTVTGIDGSNPLTIAMANLGDYRFNAGSDTGTANVDWAVQTNGQWSNTATGVVTIVDSSSNAAPVVNIYQADGTTSLNSGTLTVAEDETSANVVLKFSDDITPEEFMQGIIESSNSDIIDMSCISMVRSTTTEAGDTVTLTFTPKANAYGDVTITLGASDGDKSATQTFTLSVTPTNEQAVAQDFLKTINEDGTFYFNTISPADIYADANDANMNKGASAVDYDAQMAIIATAQQEGATEEQITAAGTAITTLVNASLFPKSFLIKTLPTHGKLYIGETEITTTDYSVAIANLASLTYVPTANYSGSDSFTWQGVDVSDLATTTKTATFTVNEVNDTTTGTVSISGTPTQGQTLSASNTLADLDGLGTISYQWKADGVAIEGATEATLVLGESHVGKVITVVASHTDDHAHAESSTSTATAAVANLNDAPTGSVTISGTATQGETLTASNTLADVDGLGTITYQWKADGEAIEGATSSTLVLGEAQVGKAITVVASYTDGHSTAESSTSTATATIANLNDEPTGSVTISGTPTQGQTLTASNTLADIDGLGTITYQWKADGEDIEGATEATLVLGESHVGKIITVVASYTDGHSTAESKTSSATTAVATPPPPPSGGGDSTPTTPTTDPDPTEPDPTDPVTTTVDGTTVVTETKVVERTTTDESGNTVTTTFTTEQLVIAPVSDTRTEQTGGATTADIPLFWGESSRTEWATTASIPTGVGLTSEGSRAPTQTQTAQTVLADLIYYIDTTAPSTDTSKTTMLGGGETFLEALSNIETLVVNKITLSATQTQETIQTPITITGVANAIATTNGSIAPQEALVIDAQTLPTDSTLHLQNVEFAVVIGEDLTIRGGEGQNILFSGAGSQDIMLGEDDDELHAGSGDDIVGSAGGDDKVFGEAGNDTVFGGEGEDLLHGGSDTDVATYSGSMDDYIITRDEGKTYVALKSAPNQIDTLINVETIQFDNASQVTIQSIASEDLMQHNHISVYYIQALDRNPDYDGFSYWMGSDLDMGDMAIAFLNSDEYKAKTGRNWNELDINGQIEELYLGLLGRSSEEIGKTNWLNYAAQGASIEDIADAFVESGEFIEISNAIKAQNIEISKTSTTVNTNEYAVENTQAHEQIATLYVQILDRQAEIDGFQYWAKSSDSLGNMAIGFMQSQEYKTKSGTNWDTLSVEEQVEELYLAILGRASDAQGKQNWLDFIASGATIEQVAQEFVNSVELSGIYQEQGDWSFTL